MPTEIIITNGEINLEIDICGAGGGGGTASGESLELNVVQIAHGFGAGDALYHNGAEYALASAANSATADVVGIVESVSGVNTFKLVLSGAITGSFTAGQYFLDDATPGLITLTPPTDPNSISKPVMVAISASEGLVSIQRGLSGNGGGGGGGGGSGDVTGPASATDNALARYNGTSGKIIQNSGATLDDSGNLTANNLSGSNTGDQNLFSTIAVSGQSNVIADGPSDTLNIAAGSGISITTNASTDTVTITATGGGSGDVVGPASSNDNRIARYDGTTGKLIQNSGASIDDSGNITGNNLSGTNTGDQNLFSTIAVSGQSNVVADSTSDTLTLAAGSGITITTNAGTDTVTITATGGGGSGDVSGPISSTDNAIVRFDGTSGKLVQNSAVTISDGGDVSANNFTGSSSGTNTGDQNLFSTIAVSGQSNVIADTTSDTLTLAAGTGIAITTDASTDTVTITSTGAASSISGLLTVDTDDFALTGSGTSGSPYNVDVSASVKGTAASLSDRLTLIGRMATPGAAPIYSGEWYTSAINSTGEVVVTTTANRIFLTSVTWGQDVTIQTLGLVIGTGVASSEMQFVIYGVGSDHVPTGTPLLQTSAILTVTNNAFYTIAASFTFRAGIEYYWGVMTNSVAGTTARGINGSSLRQIGKPTPSAVNHANVYIKAITYPTAPTSFAASDRFSTGTPTVIMQVA